MMTKLSPDGQLKRRPSMVDTIVKTAWPVAIGAAAIYATHYVTVGKQE
jgi:hypothetical protein